MHASQRTPSLLGSDDEVCNVRSVANQQDHGRMSKTTAEWQGKENMRHGFGPCRLKLLRVIRIYTYVQEVRNC